MPNRYTRETVTYVFKATKEDFPSDDSSYPKDIFTAALGPADRPGNLPPERGGEESLTLRVIKTPTGGAEILIRFAKGLDAHTVHTIEGLSTKDLVGEVGDVAKDLVKALLDPPARDAFRKEISPGVLEAVTTGRPPEGDVDQFRADFLLACDRLDSKGLRININNVASEFHYTGDNLRYHLRRHKLQFKSLVKSRRVS